MLFDPLLASPCIWQRPPRFSLQSGTVCTIGLTDLEPLGIGLHCVHEDFVGILDLLTGPFRSELRGIYDDIALECHDARKRKNGVIPNGSIAI